MSVQVRLEEGCFDPAQELNDLVLSACSDGAIVTFIGMARPQARDGEAVDRLTLEHHPRLTLSSLEEIANSGLARFDVSCVRVVHRRGEVLPGEPIVFVGVSSRHRRAAFDAADYLMDRLKTEAVFWKREDGASGSHWIEPTETDYADRNRWE